MSYNEIDILLAIEQANKTTPGNPTIADLKMVGKDFDLVFKQAQNKIPFALGQYGKYRDIPGSAFIDFKGWVPMGTNGFEAPDFEIFLRACGFKLTRVAGTGTIGHTTQADKTISNVDTIANIITGMYVGFSIGFDSADLIYKVTSVNVEGNSFEVDVAAAFTLSDAVISTYDYARQYTPSSNEADWKWLTMYKYSGAMVEKESILTAADSVLCDGTIEGTIGDVVKLSLTGKGYPGAEPMAATYPTNPPTLPSETIPLMMKASSAEFLDADYNILKFSIAFKNKVELDKCNYSLDGATYGFNVADILDRDIEVKLSVLAGNITTDSPYGKLTVGTLGIFDIQTGETNKGIQYTSANNKFQITAIENGKEQGLATLEITGKIAEDDLLIQSGV